MPTFAVVYSPDAVSLVDGTPEMALFYYADANPQPELNQAGFVDTGVRLAGGQVIYGTKTPVAAGSPPQLVDRPPTASEVAVLQSRFDRGMRGSNTRQQLIAWSAEHPNANVYAVHD